jgi:threonylcarbamoyladenosine tRNA methylthiotransferase MtaB
MKASIHTFGCKLNQYESEALASSFRGQGFFLVPPGEQADVYVVNTCTVTSKSDQKARRLIRKLGREHPCSLVIVTGCYAQLNRREIEALGDNLLVVSQEAKHALLELPKSIASHPERSPGEIAAALLPDDTGVNPFAFRVERFSFHSRGFLKIQDGCDGRCAYCRVPLARGASVSLEPEEAVARLKRLEEAGYREVVLTGVDITAYRGGLELLLRRLLAETGDVRLRLSSLEPERISSELAEVLSAPRIRPHFHVPVQSGSDEVLGRMRRRYRADVVVQAIERLREAKKDPYLAADVIVGFPGETEEDFARSRDLVEALGLSDLHVFPFSPRPGTAAVQMRPRVAERIRDRRAEELRALAGRLRDSYTQRWTGAALEAVLERPPRGAQPADGGVADGKAESGGRTGVEAATGGRGEGNSRSSEPSCWLGLTENYLEVEIADLPAAAFRQGQLVEVRFESLAGRDRTGRGRYLRSL